MPRSLFAALLVPIIGAAALAAAPGAKRRGHGWELVWHDEFGARRLDRTKWNTVMDFPGRQGGHYHNSSYGSYAVEHVPDKAMYIVLNSGVWVNADRGGPPDASTPFPNSFDVEYVRVYDHQD